MSSNDGITVRPAEERDLEGILEIYNHAVLHTTATYDYEPRTLEHRRVWFEEHRRLNLPVFVGESGEGRVVGWSALNRYHDRPGYRFTVENSVYVAEAWRGRGVGRRLMGPLVEASDALGYHVILAVIDAANEASVRLHRSFGFEEAGHLKEVGYKFDRWLDVVLMERRARGGVG